MAPPGMDMLRLPPNMGTGDAARAALVPSTPNMGAGEVVRSALPIGKDKLPPIAGTGRGVALSSGAIVPEGMLDNSRSLRGVPIGDRLS